MISELILASSNYIGIRLSGREGRALMVCIAATVLFHMTTLKLSPICWQDEVQIVEFGRSFFAAPQELPWSMNLSMENKSIVLGLISGGCVLQEIAYKYAGGSMVGPRFASLLGLAVLVLGIFKWLKQKNISSNICFITSLLVLFNPNLIQGVRGGRVDALAMAAVAWALYFINYTNKASLNCAILLRWERFFLAGVLYALGCFTWVTTIVLGLLIVSESIEVGCREKWKGRDFFLYGIIGTVGFLIIGFLFSFRFFPEIFQALQRTFNGLSTGSGFQNSGCKIVSQNLWSLIKVFTPMISLWGLAFLGLWGLRKVQWLSSYALLITILICSFQIVYTHRINYLLPYAALFTAIGLQEFLHRTRSNKLKHLAYGVVVLSLIYGFGHTICARNCVAFLQKEIRSMEPMATQLTHAIGNKDARIMTFTHQIYYAGRHNGWEMYSYWAGGAPEETIKNPHVQNLMSKVDFIVLEKKNVTAKLCARLKTQGWRESVLMIETKSGKVSKYGPYSIWKQERQALL